MILTKNNVSILDLTEYNNNKFPIELFDLKKKYSLNNNALLINFTNDFNYNLKCLKKLITLENSHVVFNTQHNNLNIKYVISNYNDDILYSLIALCITDKKERYTYIYDAMFSILDKIWKKYNPCDFCNNLCVATREHKNVQQEDGCCYSFEYDYNIFSPSFIKNKQKCKYLGPDKHCTAKNLSCKFFTCSYLKKYKNFNLRMEDYLLIMTFFNKKQQLILKHNFFHSKEELINKLLEKNSTPLSIYYLNNKYLI